MKQKPENQTGEDLFDWSKKNIKKDDGLSWKCPQCDLNGGWCSRHPKTNSTLQNFQGDSDNMESSIRIAEKEINISEAEKEAEKPLTLEETQKQLQEIRKKLAS